MDDIKNINYESEFNNRTGLIVWLKNKRNVKRLMNYGFLHYVSNKMNYAVLYIDSDKKDEIIEKIEKEQMVRSVEVSKLKDLPIKYDDVLADLKKANEKEEKADDFLSRDDVLKF